MSTFLKQLRTIGWAKETVPYTAESTVTANIRADKIEYDEDIQNTARKLAHGDLSLDQVVIGKQALKVKFEAEVYPSTTAVNGSGTSAPVWMGMLGSCGYNVSYYSNGGATGWTSTPSSAATESPMTIVIQEQAEGINPNIVQVKAHGCMGNATFSIDKVGSYPKMSYEFVGAFDGYSVLPDSSSFSVNITETAPAIPVLAATITRSNPDGQITQVCDKVKCTLGAKTELYTDPAASSGYFGAHITSRDPSAEFDPDFSEDSDPVYQDMIAPNAGLLSIGLGAGGLAVQIQAPMAQIMPPAKVGEREGHLVRNLKMRLCRNSGDDELTFTTLNQ
jgi:hypothetical protein